MLSKLFRVRGAEAGQTLAEYALILSLIAVVVIAVLIVLGTNINVILSTIAAAL